MTRLINMLGGTIRNTLGRKAVLAAAIGAMLVGPAVSSTFAGNRYHDGHDNDDHGRHYDYDHRDVHKTDVRVDLGFNFGGPPICREPQYVERTTRVWVEPVYRTACDRVWVEPVYRDDCAQVWVPERYEAREHVEWRRGHRVVVRDRVCVAPGHFETQRTRVVVCDGHWQNVERQELVCTGHWEDRVERVRVADGYERQNAFQIVASLGR